MSTVLALDPAGNKGKEGDGITGWSLFVDGKLEDFGRIKAEDFDTVEDYWSAHTDLITSKKPHKLVCEDYRLQPGKAMQQSWSELLTPQLIGYLRMHCWFDAIPVIYQSPKDKVRVADHILEHIGIIEKKGNKYYALDRVTVDHERDAIRHGVYYHKYGKG